MVGNDRIEHPHAAFVKYSEDGLVGTQRDGECPSSLFVLGKRQRPRLIGQGTNVTKFMGKCAGLYPVTQASTREVILKIFTPDRAIRHPGFRQRPIQVK